MTLAPEGPEPRRLRAWLSWVATQRWPRLTAFVRRSGYVQDDSEAPDIIHDAMVKILSGEVKLPNDRPRAWRYLLATIRNVASNRQRSDRVRDAAPLEVLRASPEELGDARERGWRICERLERTGALAAAMACLTPAQREVVELRFFQGWAIAEIAEHRGCSPGAVWSLLTRALATLEVELDGRFGAE